MKFNPQLSIIIPVYKAETYLSICLDSKFLRLLQIGNVFLLMMGHQIIVVIFVIYMQEKIIDSL